MSDAIGHAVTLGSMDAFARFAQPWLDRAARIGADPRDDDEQRFRKALLVLVCVLILPISLVWGAIYLALGASAGLIAWLYLIISIAAIVIFSRTRDTEWLLRVELLDILLAPTISMAFVGGFIGSGAVGIWGILAPLGALVFDGARAGVRWFVAFVAVFLVSGIVGELAGGGRSTLPAWFESTMIALNVTVTGAVVFMLLVQFVRQREEALAALRVEQDRAETLLLNILPRSIADRLKADTRRSPTSSPRRRSCSPTSSTSRRCRIACSRPRSSASSTTCSPTSTSWPSATGSRRSRRSATATWSRRACRRLAPTTPG